jgi:hypothetical protein
VIKSRRRRGVGHVAKMERKRYTCWDLIGKPE